MGKFARTGDAARTCNGRSGVDTMLGLPDDVHACLFDLDGVLTDTASVHRKAWKAMFDDFLRGRAQRTGKDFVPFDADADYLTYVDGKTREDGIRSFLASRRATRTMTWRQAPCAASVTRRTPSSGKSCTRTA